MPGWWNVQHWQYLEHWAISTRNNGLNGSQQRHSWTGGRQWKKVKVSESFISLRHMWKSGPPWQQDLKKRISSPTAEKAEDQAWDSIIQAANSRESWIFQSAMTRPEPCLGKMGPWDFRRDIWAGALKNPEPLGSPMACRIANCFLLTDKASLCLRMTHRPLICKVSCAPLRTYLYLPSWPAKLSKSSHNKTWARKHWVREVWETPWALYITMLTNHKTKFKMMSQEFNCSLKQEPILFRGI